MKVLVLAGGKSAERDVSIASGAAVAAALEEAGCEVLVYDPGVSSHAVKWEPETLSTDIGVTPLSESQALVITGNPPSVLSPSQIATAGLDEVDVVFIALHGGGGEDGHVQALLDTAGIPYAGSGMIGSALAMDKNSSKRIFVAEGIPTPNWHVATRRDMPDYQEMVESLGSPLVVKPNAQGSTVGLSIVKEELGWSAALEEGFRWDDQLIIEEFIPGREVTVAILGEEPLPVVEIIPSHGIYDYECKYTPGRTDYVCPADLDKRTTSNLQEQGLAAFQAVGCRGFGRVDFRLAQDNTPYCLEVNSLPGMTATSLVPKAAKAAGIEFPELVRRICELALKDAPKRSTSQHV